MTIRHLTLTDGKDAIDATDGTNDLVLEAITPTTTPATASSSKATATST